MGFGLIYLPAIVSVSMYFEKKRAFATGIAVCGSGVGTFLMAPLVHELINRYGWETAIVITGAIVLLCVPLGTLFRPIPSDSSAATSDIQVEREITKGESKCKRHLSIECCCNASSAKSSDMSLMQDGIFIMFAFSNFLTSIGFNIPYLYNEVRKKAQLQ